MKKTLFLPVLLLFGAAIAFAQPADKARKKEKIEAYRIAFITEKLNLSSAEAEKFWPIWNEHTDERDRIREQYKMDKDLDVMTDQEVEESLSRHLEGEQKELDLKKETFAKLRKVLPSRKILKLARIEREFKEELLRRIKERQKTGGGRGPNKPKLPRRN